MSIHIIFMRLYSSHQQIYAMLYTHLCPRIDRHLYCNVNVLHAHVHLASLLRSQHIDFYAANEFCISKRFLESNKAVHL